MCKWFQKSQSLRNYGRELGTSRVGDGGTGVGGWDWRDDLFGKNNSGFFSPFPIQTSASCISLFWSLFSCYPFSFLTDLAREGQLLQTRITCVFSSSSDRGRTSRPVLELGFSSCTSFRPILWCDIWEEAASRIRWLIRRHREKRES